MKLSGHLTLAVVTLCVMLAAFACTPEEDGQQKITALEVDPGTVSLTEGEKLSLKVNVTPSDAHYLYVTWSSSNESVAKINKAGTLKAIAPGSATITAALDGVTGTCSVTVAENVTPVSGIHLGSPSITMGIGSTETLIATIEPAEAVNREVIWTSSDESVATVSGGVVTAIGDGECDITATSADGGFRDVCHVIVRAIPVESLLFSNGSDLTIVADGGSTYTLIVKYTPENTSDRDLVWTSSDESLATISQSAAGQAIVNFAQDKAGVVKVTAAAGNPERCAVQQFFVKGAEPLVIRPDGILYAGRKATWSFNTAAYGEATDIKWIAGGKQYEGASVAFAATDGGESTVSVSANYGGEQITFAEEFEAQEWLVNIALNGTNPRNTYPVFNKQATRAYFVTRQPRRLYELNLEDGTLGWMFAMEAEKQDNGGDICVNPVSGDIYCSNQTRIFCLAADGSVRWEIPVPEGRTPSAFSGCGPGLSNDCTVLFASLTDKRFIAVKADSGEILDSFAINHDHFQFAVYGDNEIVYHSNSADGVGAIGFVKFSGGRFGQITRIDSPSKDGTDITTPAINRGQTRCWFPCAAGVMVEVDLTAKKVTASPKIGDGYNMQPCLTPDGNWMYFASQVNSTVCRIDPGTISGSPVPFVDYSGSSSSMLNFTSVACDTEGNAYFFIREDGAGNNTFFRISAAGERFVPEVIATIGKQNDFPQGFFNFGGGCLIGGGGSSTVNRLLVRCVDAERAKGWSGPGGDLCATKNANIAYGD
ncbi:MAG: Ig-like domain-containing protein [Bacteroidales bacterium]|nr:Ig-like domain-containing protein [Bacteroidales bacterium]